MADATGPLAGARVLVPPARPETSPLAGMLRRQGATTLHVPALEPRYPSAWASLDRALLQVRGADWIVFSGSNSVHNWVGRAGEIGIDPVVPGDVRIAAIGNGAARALRTDGREPDYVPDMHVADEIAQGLPGARNVHVLLVRVEGATDALPDALRAIGANVTAADGYRMAVRAAARDAREMMARGIDVLALANPTTLRYLQRGAELAGSDLQQIVAGAFVAAVGDATAHAAVEVGLEPGLVAGGRINSLTEAIIQWWDQRPMNRRALDHQGEAFVTDYLAADATKRQALNAAGAALARRLRAAAMDLGYSRATESSPKIRQYKQLAAKITSLLEGQDP